MFDALLISQDQKLITELQKISAVTQCSLEINSKVNNSEIKAAQIVLVDAAMDITISHPNVVLITTGEPGLEIWQKAVAMQAKYVAFLPDAREWLLQNLVPGRNQEPRIIGVLGSTGGLGASVLASLLSLEFAKQNKSVALVETQLFSGGLDVLWGIEDTKGTRWADLIYPTGQISPQDLYRSLPKAKGIAILSGDSQDSRQPINLNEIVNNLANAVDVLIIDLSKQTDVNSIEIINQCSDLIIVTGSTIRSTSAANQFLQLITNQAKVKLVVRVIPGAGLDAQSIAKTLGLELLGELPTDQKVTEHLEQGLSPADISSNNLRKATQEIFENLENTHVSAVA